MSIVVDKLAYLLQVLNIPVIRDNNNIVGCQLRGCGLLSHYGYGDIWVQLLQLSDRGLCT